ncbi:MAG: hypothetical protein Q9216_000625 [Gyalolechia sp. 2 TL-2023]
MASRRIVPSHIEKDEGSFEQLDASEKSDIAPAVPASTWAGATAAFTANLVLIAYVIVAMKEDQSEKLAAEEYTKKKK